MAGVEGFEPSNAGIKIRCLNRLATPQYRSHPISSLSQPLDTRSADADLTLKTDGIECTFSDYVLSMQEVYASDINKG